MARPDSSSFKSRFVDEHTCRRYHCGTSARESARSHLELERIGRRPWPNAFLFRRP